MGEEKEDKVGPGIGVQRIWKGLCMDNSFYAFYLYGKIGISGGCG